MSQANPTDFQANAYAENYVLYGDQSRAFRSAFPESKGSMHSVNTKASKFNKLVVVQSRVEEIRSKLSKQTEEEFNITVSDLKKMLVIAAQGGLKTRLDAQQNKVLNNIAGAVSAISEINRMDGNHYQYKVEQNINVTHNIMPVPTAASTEDWEKSAIEQQDEVLNK